MPVINKSIRGASSEYYVIAVLLEQGFDVLLPAVNSMPYDMVIKCTTKHYALQIKTLVVVSQNLVLKFRGNLLLYKKTCDFFIGYEPQHNRMLFYPIKNIKGNMEAITFSTQKNMQKISRTELYYEDWGIEKLKKYLTGI